MPFDNTAFTETRPDVFTLEALAAWLRTQPGYVKYDWYDTSDCLYHRYLKHHWVNGHDEYQRLRSAISPDAGVRRPWTYAAALARCETLLARNREPVREAV